MTDNPFSEPDDSDRTIIRPLPGGKRPAAAGRTAVLAIRCASAAI